MPGTDRWGRLSTRTLSRRAVLSASARAGVGAAGLALVGCGDDDDDDAAAQVSDQEQPQDQGAQSQGGQQTVTEGPVPGEFGPGEDVSGLLIHQQLRLQYHPDKLLNLPGQADGPAYGGRWTSGHVDPGAMNPLGATGSLLAAFALFFYNQLVSFGVSDYHPNNWVEPEGDLATGWETPDDTTWVFNIDQQVMWQDEEPVNGREMTMDDVRLGYAALKDAPVQSRDYFAIQSIEADESGRTVRFNMTEPTPYLLNVMMTPYHVIIPPEMIGNELLDTWAVGSGPFVLRELETGVKWFAERNPNYFRRDPNTGMQLPYLDEMEGLDFLGQREANIAAWAASEVGHIVAADLIDLEEFQELQPDSVTMVTAPPPGWQPYILFKLQEEPWNDTRVRRALSFLMDREEQREGVFNGMAAAGIGMDWTFFSDPSHPRGFREWPWEPAELDALGGATQFNADEGNSLLDAAGFTPDNPLKFDFDFHSVPGAALNQMLLIVDQWQRNSGGRLEVNFNQGEWVAWFGRLVNGEFTDLLGHYQYGPAQDPDQYINGPMHSESPGNFYGINDPQIDQWAREQRVETDYARREEIWLEVMKKDLSETWRIWTLNPYRIALRREWMFNLTDTYNAWNPGWGEKGAELVWINERIQAEAT